MSNNYIDEVNIPKEYNETRAFLLFILALALGFFVSNLLAMYIVLPLFEGDMSLMVAVLSNPAKFKEYSMAITALQGIMSFLSFVVCPLLFLRYVYPPFFKPLINIKNYTKSPIVYLYVFLIVVFLMPVNSVFIQWNENITFPESLKWFETLARDYELKAQELTEVITSFSTIPELIVAILVIGVIAAVGEEIVFRGCFQQFLTKMTANPHIAIWASAFIFSAIHFQFFGLIPRMFLGVMFGYMYFWSKDIMIPIFAHFVNNTFTVVVLYMHNTGNISYDIESKESLPISVWLPATMICIVLIVFLRQRSIKKIVIFE